MTDIAQIVSGLGEACQACCGTGAVAAGGDICCGGSQWECGADGCTGPIDGRYLEQCQICEGTGIVVCERLQSAVKGE